jgi:hypothetical protein
LKFVMRATARQQERRPAMTTGNRFSATLATGAIAIGVAASAFGQADNTNSVIAPAMPPSYSQGYRYDYPPRYHYDHPQRYQYDYSQRYRYEVSRQAYIDDAARQWDALHGYREIPPPYIAEKPYAEPYPSERLYSRDRRVGIGGPGLPEDSNPNDYATGIYNPKP